MSRIDDLIRDLCPDGVEYRAIGSLGQWRGGGTPSKSRPEFWENGTIPWVSPKDMGAYELTSTQDKITLQATRESSANLVPGPSLAVVSRSSILQHTLPVSIVPFEASFNQDTKTLTPSKHVNLHYIAHALRAHANSILATTSKRGGSVNSLILPKFLEYKIPLPPLPIQEEVVHTLSNFTHLTTRLEMELKAELEARKLQFTYCRNTLILQNASHYTPTKLKDIGRIITGKTPPTTAEDSWGDHINFATPSDIRTDTTRLSTTRRRLSAAGAERLRSSLVPSGSILVTCIGADMGKAVESIGDCIPNQQINAIINDGSFSSRYLVHVLSNIRTSLQRKASQGGGTMPLINKSDFSLIELRLPPLKEQCRIADSLDEFDTLVNDLTLGLLAEIEARRKQYEYYRDRLLTFPEKK